MRYTYSFPTLIRFGAGVIDELNDYLINRSLTRPLVVTDPNVRELDFFKNIISSLEASGIMIEIFSDMHKNPIKSDVLAGGDLYDETQRDSIIGIGGGVAMDVARAIALRVNHKGDLFEYDDLIGGDKNVKHPIPPFITVPTTSGTGSEVGRSAIISEDESKKKRILFHPSLLAQMVFADPALTTDLPPFITAATGMDALTHNMEAFLAKGHHPMADGIALEAMGMIVRNIEKATNDGADIEARSNMMLGSLMGAVAFQKGLGIVHSLAHPLSSLLDTHHGLANAVNLPYGMHFNYAGFEDRFDRMAHAFGLGEGQGDQVPDFIFQLNEKIGMPHKLNEIGVKEEHLEELADLAFADFCHPANPKPVTREDFLSIYTDAL